MITCRRIGHPSYGASDHEKEGLWAGLIRHTLAGGIGSVLGGGKFGNGALTGAFGYLFNHCGGEIDCGGYDESEQAVFDEYGWPEKHHDWERLQESCGLGTTCFDIVASAPTLFVGGELVTLSKGAGGRVITNVADSLDAVGGALKGASVRFLGKEGPVFGRGGKGLLNSNDYFRIGWGWNGPAIGGRDVFRIGIGSKRLPFHYHFDLF